MSHNGSHLDDKKRISDANTAQTDELDALLNELKRIEASLNHLLESCAHQDATASAQIESAHAAFDRLIQLVISQRKRQCHETET